MTLNREDIIGKKNAIEVKAVTVPVWGEVFVRKLSAKGIEQVEAIRFEARFPANNYHGRISTLLLCDKDGNLVFQESDADELGNRPDVAEALIVAVKQGLIFNKLSDPAAENEATKKN